MRRYSLSTFGRRVAKVGTGLLIALGLSGCAISTPFRGPGYDPAKGVTAPGAGPVMIAITQATLRDDRARSRDFWAHVRLVEASLAGQPGLIGHSIRTELLGPDSWTMTVWVDEDSLRAFVEDTAHQDAIRGGGGALARARFARTRLERAEAPLSWGKALEILEATGRWYEGPGK